MELVLCDDAVIVCVDDAKLDSHLLDDVVLEARLLDSVRLSVGHQKPRRQATGIGLLDELPRV